MTLSSPRTRAGGRARSVGVAAAALALFAGPLSAAASASPADPADFVQVFNRDVNVIVGPNLVEPTTATDPAAPLFTDTGIAMEITWGQWSAATAESVARVTGGGGNPRTDFRLRLSGLVPGGLYSLFWGTLGPDSEHPLCPGVERTLPLDRVGGGSGLDPNSFRAGPDGAAAYHGRAPGDLLAAQQVFLSVVYRFYEEPSPYPLANLGQYASQGDSCRSSYGEDAMRHLLVLQKT
jgi:hypothetical protein